MFPLLPLLTACGGAANSLAATPLVTRVPLEKGEFDTSGISPHDVVELHVKFVDSMHARAEFGVLRGSADLRAARAVLAGATLSPLIDLKPARMDSLLDRAARNSGRSQPDLGGMVRIAGLPVDAMLVVGERLTALPEVEFVSASFGPIAPPSDISPPTSDYEALALHLNPNPGVDADAAWSLGHTGLDVRVADVEYAVNTDHEDLEDQPYDLESGQTPRYTTGGYEDHGTATNGEIFAGDNGYGAHGLAPDASPAFYTEWSSESGSRRATAITAACADSAEGDIVMLEMQTYGARRQYVPAEYEAAVWTAVKVCTDAGVVVIGAAGNGNQNLDAPAYAAYRARGDSGAILVGAGGSTTAHDRLSYSTYGTRVNVQGWGVNVFTLGYGDYAAVGGDYDQEYTSAFSGTSSATPMVTGVVALLQSAALTEFGVPMTPANVRALLVATGHAQGSSTVSRPIGPLPDVDAALGALLEDADGDGWGIYVGDCNDARPLIHPGAPERVNGIDDDCDGLIDG